MCYAEKETKQIKRHNGKSSLIYYITYQFVKQMNMNTEYVR